MSEIEQNIVYEDTLLEITPELMKKTIVEQDKEIERLHSIIKEVRETLIKSKEYKMAKEMNLTSKMSVLIELLEIINKALGSDKE